MTSSINFDRRALERRAQNKWRNVEAQVAPRPESRLKTIFAYGVVAVGVAVAAFYVTPVRAAGSMANTPSIVYMGEKAKLDIRRDNNKALNTMQLQRQRSADQLRLEDAKSLHQRQLAEDRAYYEKLKDQRKHK